MDDLFKRMQKASTVKADILSQSRYFGDDDFIDTGVPLMNLALSGKFSGGFVSGLTCFAGPSKHFKSSYLCLCIAAFQRKYPDGWVVFYDSEFGSKKSYFENFGIDTDRVLHAPIVNIEQLKFDIMKKLDEAKVEDHLMFAIDSIGNLASKKEVEDALTENTAADMTRAKQLKSFGRMVTPQLALKKIPMIAVNHTYQTIEMFSKEIMGGGTGFIYSSDTIIFVGRRQNKDGKELLGYDFDLVINKSRFVKDQARFPITVSYDEGVSRYSGIFDLMLEHTDIVIRKGAWYEYDGKNVRKAELVDNEEFMESLLANKEFVNKVEAKYTLDLRVKAAQDEKSEKSEETDEKVVDS